MFTFSFTKKKNVLRPAEAPKWYAVTQSKEAQSVKKMTAAATENTSTAAIEMEASIELFGKYAIKQLLDGHAVRFGSWGIFRITFKSEGVDNLDDFNTAAMIKNPRIIFIPSKEFRNSVMSEIKFQNGGVLEEGIHYASLADYRKAKGIPPVEPTE